MTQDHWEIINNWEFLQEAFRWQPFGILVVKDNKRLCTLYLLTYAVSCTMCCRYVQKNFY